MKQKLTIDIQINSKILSTCSNYATFTSSFSRYLLSSDPDLASKSSTKSSSTTPSLAFDPTKLDKLEDLLGKFEENFSRHLKILLDTLNYLAATETVVFLSLCARLSTASDGWGLGSEIQEFG
jgi:gamma-tubulin complex component 2